MSWRSLRRLYFVLSECMAKVTFYASDMPPDIRQRWAALYLPGKPPVDHEAWEPAFIERIKQLVGALSDAEVQDRVADVFLLAKQIA